MKTAHLTAIVIAAVIPAAALLAQGEQGKMGGMMKGDQGKMTEMHQKMQAEMKAQDAELDKLVAAMNSASGDKKVDAMGTVVSKMVEQRKAMHDRMSGMHEMMRGMMQGGMMDHGMMKGKDNASPSPTAR